MNNIKTFENFNNKDIFEYIKNGDIQSIKNYIDYGYDLNIKNLHGDSPLIHAAKYDKIEIVKLLLNAGVGIDEQNNLENQLKNLRNGAAGALRNLNVKETAKRNLSAFFLYLDYFADFM